MRSPTRPCGVSLAVFVRFAAGPKESHTPSRAFDVGVGAVRFSYRSERPSHRYGARSVP